MKRVINIKCPYCGSDKTRYLSNMFIPRYICCICDRMFDDVNNPDE